MNYKVGDLVRIRKTTATMENSPVDIFEGSIVEIKTADCGHYTIRFVDVKAKNNLRKPQGCEDMMWSDMNFDPVNDFTVTEIDVLGLL